MNDLDDSIGKLLLDLQNDDPDTFRKIAKLIQETDCYLFESVDKDHKKLKNNIQNRIEKPYD